MRVVPIVLALAISATGAVFASSAEAATKSGATPACQYDGTDSPSKITLFRIPGEGVKANAPFTVIAKGRGKITGHLVRGEATIKVRSANVVRVTVAGRLCETT